MTYKEKCWLNIDRAVGYLQGFLPAIWAMSTLDEKEVVASESINELEQVVSDLASYVARVREIGDKE